MSHDARLFNLGEPFEFEGVEYRFAEVPIAGEAEFKRWLVQRAYAAAEYVGAVVGPEAGRAAVQQAGRDVAAGYYDWAGPAHAEAVRTVEGEQYLLWLSLKVHHPQISHATAKRIHDWMTAQAHAILNRLRNGWPAEEPDAPKGQTPADTTPANPAP